MTTHPYPVFIICRDRVTALARLVEWLERVGQRRIFFVDNASTYPPLLEYYASSPHRAVFLGRNAGHLAPWREHVIETYAPGEHYVVTDPDVLPVGCCPEDALERFRALLDSYPEYSKVGFGLKVDDLPSHYRHAKKVRAWELHEHWKPGPEPGTYAAAIDTTFAMYRPGEEFSFSALRTGEPYLARHLPWYVDSAALDEEESYYRDHASSAETTWNVDRISPRVEGLMVTRGALKRSVPRRLVSLVRRLVVGRRGNGGARR